MARKLGCVINPRHPLIARLPRFGSYLAPALVPSPYSDWSPVMTVPWGMYGNDQVGDCVYAGATHQIMTWLAAASDPTTFSTQEVLADYSRDTGYNPSDPSTDQGSDPMNMIRAWATLGLVNGHKIDASAIIDTWDHARVSIDINAGVLFCLQFPAGWENAKTWDVSTAGSQIAGGHLVYGVAQDSGAIQVITWGEQRTLVKDGWERFCTMTLGVMGRDFAMSDQGTPDAMAYNTLIADMPALA